MSRVCQITGRKTASGHKVSRRGLAKAKGGVGKKTTGITKRKFKVNLHWKRLWVAELNQYVRVRLSTKALRTVTKKGAYRTLLEAGLISAVKPEKKKEGA